MKFNDIRSGPALVMEEVEQSDPDNTNGEVRGLKVAGRRQFRVELLPRTADL